MDDESVRAELVLVKSPACYLELTPTAAGLVGASAMFVLDGTPIMPLSSSETVEWRAGNAKLNERDNGSSFSVRFSDLGITKIALINSRER